MRWSDHQRAMLREMGLDPWSQGAAAGGVAPDAVDPPSAAPMREPVGAPNAAPPVAPASLASPGPIARAPHIQDQRPMAAPSGAHPVGDIATMDWPVLRATVAGCRACGLCEGRTQTVFGVGHEQAHWMLVGEAPGEQEDRQGEPFVGKAGQLLDAMLRSVGLTRQRAAPQRQVYIANVLKCRPPHNRNPLPQEVAQCEPFLARQVALVQPRLILAMGRFAVQSILQTQEPIGRLRGKVHHYHGVPVVVTYHPAYLLRNPLDKARSWEDLCLAREVLQAQALPPV